MDVEKAVREAFEAQTKGTEASRHTMPTAAVKATATGMREVVERINRELSPRVAQILETELCYPDANRDVVRSAMLGVLSSIVGKVINAVPGHESKSDIAKVVAEDILEQFEGETKN